MGRAMGEGETMTRRTDVEARARQAAQAYHEARMKYRSREITDDEFMAARKLWDETGDEWDRELEAAGPDGPGVREGGENVSAR